MKSSTIAKKYKKQFFELKYLYAELDYFEDELKDAVIDFKEAFFERCKEKNIPVNKPEENAEPVSPTNSTEVSTFVSEEKEEQNTNSHHIPHEEIKLEDIQPEEKDEDLTKLYKKIVFLTHPDTIPANEKPELKEKRIKQFLEAQEAYKNKNWFLLCQLALDLGLEIPEPQKKHLKWMDGEAIRIKERINHIKSLFAWVWYTKETEEEKQRIMDHYISVAVK